MIADACDRLAGGATYAAVGEALGVAKEAVAGLVYRLRFKKDPRLPSRLLTPQSGKVHGGQRPRPENIGPGMTTMATKPAIGDLHNDRVRRNDARYGCEKLLRAQLRAGQHLLPKSLAIAVGATLGMHAGSVRAATGDPTAARQA
jgi:hypothetical protein